MLQKILVNVLVSIITLSTPSIKEEIAKGLDSIEGRAKATPNPIDDLLVSFLRALLGA